jgi:hypothetical protein
MSDRFEVVVVAAGAAGIAAAIGAGVHGIPGAGRRFPATHDAPAPARSIRGRSACTLARSSTLGNLITSLIDITPGRSTGRAKSVWPMIDLTRR